MPDAFGPRNLNITDCLFDGPTQTTQPADLTEAAIEAARSSYAPYSHLQSAVALQAGERIITGRYAENAAFNPSMLPLQNARENCADLASCVGRKSVKIKHEREYFCIGESRIRLRSGIHCFLILLQEINEIRPLAL